ncbi:MFS transporter [Streptomyces sp. DW26H14]|uniref:MFS transporter n=1 Tax=Streptomyces sp. DW26H14 TaxID=3435395 RepID=UPI00403D60DD
MSRPWQDARTVIPGARPVAGAAPGRPAHRDPNVLRWLGAYTASTVGDSVYFLALSWAATRGGSTTQAGIVLAAGAVPRAVLMLGGGVLADRLGPRRLVLGSDAARCLVILAAAAFLLLATPALWLLLTLALVFGAVDALFLPAVGALPPRITGRDQLARVQGMRGLSVRFANVAGAPLGGMLVALGGSGTAFAAAGVLFGASYVTLLAVRIAPAPAGGPNGARRPAEPAGPLRDLADGLRHIRGNRVLCPLVLVVALSELGFSGPLNLGLTLLVRERGWGAEAMGWLVSAFGLGAGAVSLLLVWRGRIPRAGLVMGLGIVAGAIAVAVLGAAPTVPTAVLAALAVGLLAGLGGALCGALAQTYADPGHLGRVTSVTTFFTLGIAPLNYPVTGAVVAAWGTAPVYLAGAALCAAGGLIALGVPALRRATLGGG